MASVSVSLPAEKPKFVARPRPEIDRKALMDKLFEQNKNTFAALAK
jgi:hypothetical protein